MINWNEVTVGETEIVNPSNEKWLVVCGHKERVWLCRGDFFQTREERSLDRWTIYDPWEEITNNCQWVRYTHTDTLWVLYHENQVISHVNPRYRVDAPRVWKRKEG